MLKSTKPTIRAYFREGKIKGQKLPENGISQKIILKIFEWRLSSPG